MRCRTRRISDVRLYPVKSNPRESRMYRNKASKASSVLPSIHVPFESAFAEGLDHYSQRYS